MSKDPHKPLRDDVRLLGELLGETLRRDVGITHFERVERVRALAKLTRTGSAEDDFEMLAAELRAMPVDAALSRTLGGRALAPSVGDRVAERDDAREARGGLDLDAPTVRVDRHDRVPTRLLDLGDEQHVTVRVGRPFRPAELLPGDADRRSAKSQVTTMIMERIAELLPPSQRGVYGAADEAEAVEAEAGAEHDPSADQGQEAPRTPTATNA